VALEAVVALEAAAAETVPILAAAVVVLVDQADKLRL
jgi:hypothetical protein